MSKPHRFSTCFWFEKNGEEAANFYCSLFPNSRVTGVSRHGKDAPMPEGTELMVAFELDETPFQILNGGPYFKLSEAASISVSCNTQDEIDRLWEALTSRGGSESHCGWLKDRWGLSWQIVPSVLGQYMTDPDKAKVARVAAAFMPMKKFDIATISAAYHE